MTGRVLEYGDRALLVELGTLDQVLEMQAALAETRPPGVVDLIPAARTLTVTIDPARMPLERARAWVASTAPAATGRQDGQAVTLDVQYGGPDLTEVARLLGIGEDEVVRLHTSSQWRVAFTGFAPGFGYLVTDHDRLTVPRRSSPRTAVPSGSVGLAGEFSGVYPRSSPGGWQLIGTTTATLWDPAAPDPALLAPGRAVRFRSV